MADKQTHDYRYGTKEDREQTASELLTKAKNARVSVEQDWKVFANYYNGKHDSKTDEMDDLDKSSVVEDIGLCDAYTQIESQIDTNLPEPIFRGREKTDVNKAKQREFVVKSVLYKNNLQDKMTANERAMRLFGDAFMKVYYDINADFDGGQYAGDIVVDCINTEDFFPDACAEDLNSCEYIDYVYRIHKRKAMRIWRKELKKAEIDIYNIGGTGTTPTTVLGKTLSEDEVEVQEHWYRDDDGDIACSILIDGKEIKHIAKYWEKTAAQNKKYPFVHFYRIKNVGKFWSQSELKAIIPMIKAGDSILQSALLNMEFSGNDILVVEPSNLLDAEDITNEAGQVINVKAGASTSAIRRLGGINNLGQFLNDLEYIQNEIQKTCRNYDTNQGKETAHQNTASGLAMLRADAATQSSIKDADRLNGFKRLFQLIDWTALEFYDDDRMIYLGVPNSKNRTDMEEDKPMVTENYDTKMGDIFFKFNSDNVAKTKMTSYYAANGAEVMEATNYFPIVDVEVNATAGIQKSKTYTIQALQSMLQTQITQANYKIVIALLRELEIPQTEEIIDNIELMYAPTRGTGNSDLDAFLAQLPPEQQATLRSNSTLMAQVSQEFTNNYGGNVYKQPSQPTA